MQRSKKLLALTFVTSTLISVTAMGQTLAQRASHRQDETALHTDLVGTGTQGDTGAVGDCTAPTMTAAYDWTNFDKLAFPPPFAPSQHGHDFVSGVRNFCKAAADNKAAVKQKIQHLVIAYGGEGKGGYTLAGGTFTYTIDPKKGSPNSNDIIAWLGSHL